jgi:hypothetical protein
MLAGARSELEETLSRRSGRAQRAIDVIGLGGIILVAIQEVVVLAVSLKDGERAGVRAQKRSFSSMPV